ncbi:MAG: DUF3617 family protein [Brevundimonas sp.]|uniref:DUF3617 family protein n=1 Tax=Brevundimonas sp. TaxID=1871086 RepID=UPI00391CCC48
MGAKVKLGLVLGVAVLVVSACAREEPAVSEPAGGEPADAPEAAEGARHTQPVLRDGLWVMASETDGMRSAMRMCVDADVQQRMSILGSQMSGGACEESTVTPRPGGGWAVRSVCDMGSGGRVVSEGVTTGDLNNAYRTETTSTTTGAAVPHMNRSVTQVVEGEHRGDCPDGMQPGDLEAPGGIRFNMLEMAEMAGRSGAP